MQINGVVLFYIYNTINPELALQTNSGCVKSVVQKIYFTTNIFATTPFLPSASDAMT